MSASKTAISWTDRTWNPTRGCSLVSPGCTNCYAMRMAHRWDVPGGPYDGLTRVTEHGPVWTGKIKLSDRALTEPLTWKQPSMIFVNSMSDLFHPDIPDEFIISVFAVMGLAGQHIFQVLTKRPQRMREFMHRLGTSIDPLEKAARAIGYSFKFNGVDGREHSLLAWPIPNIWLGVSVENQATANERIPILSGTPAAVSFLSVEPLLESVDLGLTQRPEKPGWVIVGGESGPGARRCDDRWIASIVNYARAANVPCFVKQLGSMSSITLQDRKGADPSEWPESLRVQEFPKTEVQADAQTSREP